MVEKIDTFVKGASAECISVKNSSVGGVSVGVTPADGRNRLGASAKDTPVKNPSVEDTCVRVCNSRENVDLCQGCIGA